METRFHHKIIIIKIIKKGSCEFTFHNSDFFLRTVRLYYNCELTSHNLYSFLTEFLDYILQFGPFFQNCKFMLQLQVHILTFFFSEFISRKSDFFSQNCEFIL